MWSARAPLLNKMLDYYESDNLHDSINLWDGLKTKIGNNAGVVSNVNSNELDQGVGSEVFISNLVEDWFKFLASVAKKKENIINKPKVS
jgi:hypothetical protein